MIADDIVVAPRRRGSLRKARADCRLASAREFIRVQVSSGGYVGGGEALQRLPATGPRFIERSHLGARRAFSARSRGGQFALDLRHVRTRRCGVGRLGDAAQFRQAEMSRKGSSAAPLGREDPSAAKWGVACCKWARSSSVRGRKKNKNGQWEPVCRSQRATPLAYANN